MSIDIGRCYKRAEEVISRKIEGETILLPLIAGVGDLDAEMFSLNKTGTIVWENMTGASTLNDIILKISTVFNTPTNQIRKDVIDLAEDLLRKQLIIEIPINKIDDKDPNT
jgi:hypothetical protein